MNFTLFSSSFTTRSDLSIMLSVNLSNRFLGTLLVPISALLSPDAILIRMQVPSAYFSFRKFSVNSRCLKFHVMCGSIDASTHALLSSSVIVGSWVHPILFSIPLLAMTSAFRV